MAIFSSLGEKLKNVFSKLTKRSLEPLIKSGSLDKLGFSRKSMFENIENICEIGRQKDKGNAQFGTNSLFAEEDFDTTSINLHIHNTPEYNSNTLLQYEFECLGIYIGGHPLDRFKPQIDTLKGVSMMADL